MSARQVRPSDIRLFRFLFLFSHFVAADFIDCIGTAVVPILVCLAIRHSMQNLFLMSTEGRMKRFA
jgi:hypothetical protein